MTRASTASISAFTRASRLTEQAEFRRVFARADVSRDRYFKVLFRPNGRERSRLGMAVSVKVCRRAVGRNRLKRVIRESFRNNPDLQNEVAAMDVVVLPTRLAATICNRTLTEALDLHWHTMRRKGNKQQGNKQGKN